MVRDAKSLWDKPIPCQASSGKNMKNMVFGDYVAIRYTGKKHGNKYYIVKCSICGHEKECGISNLRKQDNSHSKFNCKEDYYKEYVGKVFGDFVCTSIERTPMLGMSLVLKCKVCGHTVRKHLKEIAEMRHSASRCGEDYYKNMIGSVYGDQRIVGFSRYVDREVLYECECVKCGVKSYRKASVLRKELKHGRECYKQIPNSPIKTAIAQRWSDMYERCNNPKNNNYIHYGARGIKLKYKCPMDLYMDFAEELASHAKIHGLRNSTFDRIDVNGNYEKENLRIATQSIQSTNTTKKKIFILKKGGASVISDNTMHCGRVLGVNGRSIGNVVRGKSKTAGGWKLGRILSPEEDPYKVIEEEGVTTNLLTTV